MRRLTLAVAVILAAVRCDPSAHADASDDQFIAALNAAGVPGDRGAEIGIAHDWCQAQTLPRISPGVPPPHRIAMMHVFDEAAAQGVQDGPQTVALKTAARDAYCPGTDLS